MSRTYHHCKNWGHKVRARCKWLTTESRRDKHLGRIEFWIMNEPSHWHRQYSTKPRRARERLCYAQLRKGYDADDMVWPCNDKPHIYYW